MVQPYMIPTLGEGYGNAMRDVAMLKQRDRALAADEQSNALMQQRFDAGQNEIARQREQEQTRMLVGAIYADVKRGNPRGIAAGQAILDGIQKGLGQQTQDPAAIAEMLAGAFGLEVEKTPGPITAQEFPGIGAGLVQDGKLLPGAFRTTPQVPQQAPARPQLVEVTLPDGTIQKQWLMPGKAEGTPIGQPQKPKADREAQKTEIQLAATFANQSKDFNTVSGQYRRVLAVSRKPSPANDFALIYAFAKIQDPTSVVRESEFAQAAKTGAFGDQVAAAIGRVANGKTLTEQQRFDFVNAARNAYEAQRQQWESSVVAPAKQQAEAYGLNWENIYKDYTVKEEDSPPKAEQKSFKHSSGATVTILEE